MAEQEEPVDVEVEAKGMGWSPLDQWRGDAARWVDAETFVKNGHTVLPILRKTNKELEARLASTAGELAQVKAALNETSESVKALTTFQAAEVKRQVEAKVASLKAELRTARKDDPDSVDDLEEELDTAKDQLREIQAAPPPAAKTPAPPAPTAEPWALEWAAENADWWLKDKKKTALQLAISDELKSSTTLRGKDLLNKAKEEMEAIMGGPTPRTDKAEDSSRGGSGGGGGGKPKTGYASLSAEEKAACNAQEKQMVGPKKPFKTSAEWQAHFVSCL